MINLFKYVSSEKVDGFLKDNSISEELNISIAKKLGYLPLLISENKYNYEKYKYVKTNNKIIKVWIE